MQIEEITVIRNYLRRRIDWRRGEIAWMLDRHPNDNAMYADELQDDITTLQAELTYLVDVENGEVDANA